MRTRSLVIALLVACAPSPVPESQALQAVSSSAGCIDPATFGAIANDGLSDRVPIQVALDVVGAMPDGGTVCLGPGRWSIDRAPDGSYNNHAGLSTHDDNVSLVGAGLETIIELVGDQGKRGIVVISIDPSAEHIRIANLTVDTTAATNTHEQTHALGTSGVCSGETCQPIKDIEFRNVGCIHPRNTADRKGDCFRLLGSAPETEVYGIRLIGNHVTDAARAAVELQRGLHGPVIIGNTFHCEACDQVIDGEATGGAWVFDTVIMGNVVTSGPAAQGDYDISCTSCDGGVVANNKLSRGIALYRTQYLAVTGNVITTVATRTDDGGTIRLRNICDGNVVSNNTIRRSGAPGPLISLEPQSGGVCAGASVTGNVLTQQTPRGAIYAEAFGRGTITGNTIRHTVEAPGFSAIYNRSTIAEAPVTALAIAHNSISGPVTYAVRLQAYPGKFGAGIALSGNTAVGPVFGLYAEDANFDAPIVSSGNSWMAGVGPHVTVGAGVP